jgi:hypothetical protein
MGEMMFNKATGKQEYVPYYFEQGTPGGGGGYYTVQSGDSYESVSQKALGSERFFQDIMQANGGAPLRPGMTIRIPSALTGFVSNERAMERGMASTGQLAAWYKTHPNGEAMPWTSTRTGPGDNFAVGTDAYKNRAIAYNAWKTGTSPVDANGMPVGLVGSNNLAASSNLLNNKYNLTPGDLEFAGDQKGVLPSMKKITTPLGTGSNTRLMAHPLEGDNFVPQVNIPAVAKTTPTNPFDTRVTSERPVVPTEAARVPSGFLSFAAGIANKANPFYGSFSTMGAGSTVVNRPATSGMYVQPGSVTPRSLPPTAQAAAILVQANQYRMYIDQYKNNPNYEQMLKSDPNLADRVKYWENQEAMITAQSIEVNRADYQNKLTAAEKELADLKNNTSEQTRMMNPQIDAYIRQKQAEVDGYKALLDPSKTPVVGESGKIDVGVNGTGTVSPAQASARKTYENRFTSGSMPATLTADLLAAMGRQMGITDELTLVTWMHDHGYGYVAATGVTGSGATKGMWVRGAKDSLNGQPVATSGLPDLGNGNTGANLEAAPMDWWGGNWGPQSWDYQYYGNYGGYGGTSYTGRSSGKLNATIQGTLRVNAY